MRNFEYKNTILLSLLIAFLIINNYVFRVISINNISSIFIFGIIYLISILLNKNKINDKYNTYDIIQIFVIYTLGYFVLYYLGGLVVGYNKNIFNLKFLTIIKNVIPGMLLIILEENVRRSIVNNNKSIIVNILLVVFISLFNIFSVANIYNFKEAFEIFEFIGKSVIPIIATNCMLTYVCYFSNERPNIIYRIVTELYIYFVPIIPDYGPYLESVITLILPLVVFLRINDIFTKKKVEYRKKNKLLRYGITAVVVVGLFSVVLLISGMFNYQVIAVGSDSMNKAFYRGDAVIIDKISNKKELSKLKVGDIIAYNYNGKIIMHRIVKINKEMGVKYYSTKGDNNKNIDLINVTDDIIIGKIILVIKYVGYPSVYLSEKL